MFRSMRRSRQQLENDETIKILRSGTTRRSWTDR